MNVRTQKDHKQEDTREWGTRTLHIYWGRVPKKVTAWAEIPRVPEQGRKTSDGKKERYMDTKWLKQRLCKAAEAGSLGDAEAEEQSAIWPRLDLGAMDQAEKGCPSPTRLAPPRGTLCVEDDGEMKKG